MAATDLALVVLGVAATAVAVAAVSEGTDVVGGLGCRGILCEWLCVSCSGGVCRCCSYCRQAMLYCTVCRLSNYEYLGIHLQYYSAKCEM